MLVEIKLYNIPNCTTVFARSCLRYPVLGIYICKNQKLPWTSCLHGSPDLLPSDVEDYFLSHITATVRRKGQTPECEKTQLKAMKISIYDHTRSPKLLV